MSKKHDYTEKQHHEAAPSARPVLNTNSKDVATGSQQAQNIKSAQHSYSVEDKRKEARIEHTNGSTPKRDQ